MHFKIGEIEIYVTLFFLLLAKDIHFRKGETTTSSATNHILCSLSDVLRKIRTLFTNG